MYCHCQWEPLCPIVLLVHRDRAQELLHPLILSLRQTVRLRVKGHRHVLSYSQSGAQGFCESQRKLRVSVGDDLIGQAKPPVYVLKIEVGDSFSSYRLFARDKNRCSGAPMVYYREYRVEAVA